jgi:hypothetical protein
MAKITFSAQFDNEQWKPIVIEREMPDNVAYAIYRRIIPKRSDFAQSESSAQQPEFSDQSNK